MTHPFSPCHEQCQTPEWCFSDGGCEGGRQLSNERHDEEPDDFIYPENAVCPAKSLVCDASGFCRDQLMLPSQTAWYQDLVWLCSLIDHHQIWLLSGHVSDQCIVDNWLACKAEPTVDEKLRLVTAKKWLQCVLEARGEDIAKAWLIGRHLAGQSPEKQFGTESSALSRIRHESAPITGCSEPTRAQIAVDYRSSHGNLVQQALFIGIIRSSESSTEATARLYHRHTDGVVSIWCQPYSSAVLRRSGACQAAGRTAKQACSIRQTARYPQGKNSS